MNKKYKRGAFTLIEVLISITLLSLVLMALYRSADILRASNKNLFHYLDSTSNILKGAKTLYMDLIQADGNITIQRRDEFHRIIIENTQHSLYGLSSAKVVWLVYKDKNRLFRVEGGEYHIPLKEEESVAIDTIAINMELFKAYKSKKKDKILIIMKKNTQDAQTFMVQNIPVNKKPNYNMSIQRGKKGNTNDKNTTSTYIF